MTPADLALEFRSTAKVFREHADESVAIAYEKCANRVEQAFNEEDNVLLNLQQAAEESGYSTDHLGRLVRGGKIPNAGRPGAPRIARRDLPTQSTRKSHGVAEDPEQSDSSFEQIVQSIITEGVG